MSKEWTVEAESSSSIKIYCDFRILLCTIGDAALQEVFYNPKVGVNVMSKTMAEHIAPEEPLTFFCKHLKWIDGQIVESKGILHVMSLKMGHNKIFLDFHIFDIPEGEEFILIGQPIEPLVNSNRDQATLELKVSKDRISVNLVRSCNNIAEARPEQDPMDEEMSIIQEGLTQPNIEEDAIHFTQEIDLDGKNKLKEEKKPQPSLPKLKPLPPGLKYAFLHNNRGMLVIISDKLIESVTRKLVAVLEKYQFIIGYSLQDLKGIKPNLCTHRIPMEPDHKPSREHQRWLNDVMMEVL
jgi:hypothetical protein